MHERIGRSVGHADCDDHPSSTYIQRFTPWKYVDNCMSMSHNPSSSAVGATALRSALENVGLSCHEAQESALHSTFAGLDFCGRRNTVRASLRRGWRLRFALDVVLSQAQLSGAQLEALLGHFTWSALVRREASSILHTVYDVVRAHHNESVEVPEIVRF